MHWNLYYIIWSDAIRRVQKSNPKMKDWKWQIYFYMTTVHSFNLFIIILWLKYFEVIRIETIRFDIFPGDILDGALSFITIFAMPFILLNYFAIFHNNRYEKILQKYRKSSFWYSPFYMYSIIALSSISAIVYGLLTR
jgi:hypothetical protein